MHKKCKKDVRAARIISAAGNEILEKASSAKVLNK